MAKEITLVSSAKCFEGLQNVYSHFSEELDCKMNFAVYIPPKSLSGDSVAVMYWLSGLTCTEQNFITKSGFQRYASQYGVLVVCPDTSPRGCNVEGEDDAWDFGTGAGFYVDATQPKWKQNYRMYSYVVKELPAIIEQNFAIIANKQSISGHSMGGHGALICALKNPGKYEVVTAFAPICNPSVSNWGIKCFTGYLGSDRNEWREWDATQLVSKYIGPPLHILIDQGTADPYLNELLANKFVEQCGKSDVHVVYREQQGYEHGYYFVSTFIEDHIRHHANILY